MKRNLAVLFAAAAVLSACGGDDDTPAPSPTPTAPAPTPTTPPPPPPASNVVPGTVGATVTSFIGYLLTLVATTTETGEALDVTAVTPPLSETAEPTALP